jgi:hypothetical protein
LRRSLTACALLLAFAGLCTATALGSTQTRGSTHTRVHKATRDHAAVAFYTKQIQKYRTETWYWQRVMGVPRTPIRVRTLQSASVARLRTLAARWQLREKAAFRHAKHPPHLGAWLCIHRYEGSWQDAGAPYYGGLQMDLSFQRAYGGWLLRSKGTADHWTPLEQIWTAVKAKRARGFYPWPNTARYCGLL